MRYMGGKVRLSKHILPIMLERRLPWQTWVEPFSGGFNVVWQVPGPRIANDINRYVVAAFEAAALRGWEPPTEVSAEEYHHITHNKDQYPPELVGFVGVACSFGGIFCAGYAAIGARNYAAEGARNLAKQAAAMREGVKFFSGDYKDFPIPPFSIIYCDPPYFGTSTYKAGGIGHDEFHQWCRDRAAEGHTVYISEESAPADFKIIWGREFTRGLRSKDGSHRVAVERLYTI